MRLSWETRTLHTRWPWRIARGVFDQIEYAYVRVESEGLQGIGEAAHNARYGESLASVEQFFHQCRPVLEGHDPGAYHAVMETVDGLAPGQAAAKAAVDMALLDWTGKRLGVPLYRLWGLDAGNPGLSSFSVGIDEEKILVEKLREAEPFPILKIKLGTADDEAIMRTVRRHTDKPLRVDANEGWTSREMARDRLAMLAENGVELVEQPMPAGRLDDILWLRDHARGMPLVADEDLTGIGDLAALAQAYDGVNVKVMKVGGLQAAFHLMDTAKRLGLQVMLGCMIESSLGITAAAHLACLATWVDLDGCLLLREDPYTGVRFEAGHLILPGGSGLGVRETGETAQK